jgi:catalase
MGSSAKGDIATQIIDTMNAIYGVHRGYRAAHAKGIVCQGRFTPAPGAASLSRAPHLQRDPVPVTVRFSDSSGNPDLPSGDPAAGQRGIAIKFELPGGAKTDLIGHTVNGFPVGTPEDFLALFRAIAQSGPGAAKPTPIEKFVASHPQTARFLAIPKPAPVSYVTATYYAVHAFRFINREGKARYGRYQLRPLAGESFLDPADAAKRAPNYLAEELAARLGRGPAEFRISAQLAADGDPINDASIAWPDDRPQIELGTLAITAIVANSAAAERQLIFDPTRLVDGIELSGDPLPRLRAAAYSVSYERRTS